MMLHAQPYRDRVEAGRILAPQLAHYASRVDTLILAVPCGGVPIALELAAYLNAPVDALLARELTSPDYPELALGAIATGGVSLFDDAAIERAGITPAQLARLTAEETAELERRQQLYRGLRAPPQIRGRVVILVNDGVTNGLLMHAAVIALHRQQPAWLVVAAPVGSAEACTELAQEVHDIICPFRPHPFCSVGRWYDQFIPGDDDAVRAALHRTAGLPRA
jgi:putative phosphoribosyl transferase